MHLIVIEHMRNYVLVFTIFFSSIVSHAQDNNADSMQLSAIHRPDQDSMENLLGTLLHEDTSKAKLLGKLSYSFAFIQADKAVKYGQQGIQLSRKLGYKRGIAESSQALAMGYWGLGDYSNGLQSGLNALRLYEELQDSEAIAFSYYILANVYRDFGDYKRALVAVQEGSKIYVSLGSSDIIGYAITGSIYDLQNRLDSASFYIEKAVELDKKISSRRWAWLYYLKGNIFRKSKQYDSALYYYRTALPLVDNKDIVETYNGISILYRETGKTDSSIFYATEVIQKWRFVSYQRGILQAANILADIYKRLNQRDSAIKYLELSIALNNNMFNQDKERNIQNLAFNEQLRKDEILRDQEKNRNRLILYAVIASGLVFLLITLLLWRNNRFKQKAKEEIEKAYSELKVTQQQLIQSEKMASLGELTAGIAHEIQNPLNFVNNFSEVNTELIIEMKQEIEKGNLEEVKSIAESIQDNEQKINHHGKRADAIVKGMLQHSRSNTGLKEPTDINALTDEYVRLSYHGLRAKDKSFNAAIETNFDKKLATDAAGAGKINIIPEDIGRVLLNLLNNAFYSVMEKKKNSAEPYQPTVSISTHLIDSSPGSKAVEIKIGDNGLGIPEPVINKIFQPFFTTKPTGQGTGLGLSLSYDIVKAHGGEISVKNSAGHGAEFTIHLPI
jgi:two-component system, NtrC family, sensor kinase